MKSYLAFLTFIQAAIGAVVTRDTAAVKEITLDIVNARLAPDGVERSMRFSFN
jgi:hypothetical protein